MAKVKKSIKCKRTIEKLLHERKKLRSKRAWLANRITKISLRIDHLSKSAKAAKAKSNTSIG